jgi:hypothetical protein
LKLGGRKRGCMSIAEFSDIRVEAEVGVYLGFSGSPRIFVFL